MYRLYTSLVTTGNIFVRFYNQYDVKIELQWGGGQLSTVSGFEYKQFNLLKYTLKFCDINTLIEQKLRV